jgi:putative ABC transport system permease protein
MRGLVALAPANLTQVSNLGMDQSMLLYTIVLSVATGILVGLAPAMPALRLDITDYLRAGGRSVTASMRLRQGLITAQVAMTVVLLCGAGLLVRSLLALAHDKTGVIATDVLSLRVELPDRRYNDEQQVAFFQQLTERLRNLPGVEAAGAARDRPVSTLRLAGTSFRILGEPELGPNARHSTRVRVVTPGYFKTLGIPILKGRDYEAADLGENSPQTFVVNEAFVKKFFPSEDPLRASLSVNMRRDSQGRPDNPFGEIVGVVGNVKEGTLRGGPEPTVFYNHRKLTNGGMTLFVRSKRGPEIAREAAQIVREMDRNLPVVEVRMLDDAFADTLGPERLNAVVSAAFAVTALLLASLGLYGLLAYTVTERTNEIGIRMALGARPSQVLGMVTGDGIRLVLLGAGIGLIGAFAAARFLETLVFGVTTHDVLTFGGVTALLIAVSLIAVTIPARRAMQVNPIVALRDE